MFAPTPVHIPWNMTFSHQICLHRIYLSFYIFTCNKHNADLIARYPTTLPYSLAELRQIIAGHVTLFPVDGSLLSVCHHVSSSQCASNQWPPWFCFSAMNTPSSIGAIIRGYRRYVQRSFRYETACMLF